MPRTLLTFETLFQVLSADKALRESMRVRPTPTPPGLSSAICGMSLELLEPGRLEAALEKLSELTLKPAGVHRVD
jgi:hypothetical protein